MEALDTAERMSTDSIQLQYAAMDNLCEAFNKLVDGATLRFYPYGGSLYRHFMPRSTSKYTRTNDVDGFLVVMPDDVTLEDCLTGDEAEYEEVADRILSAYKNLHKTLFSTKEQKSLWLKAASTKEFTLTKLNWVFEDGENDVKKDLLGRGDVEIFQWGFDLSIILHSSGDEKINFDAHCGVLQRPVYGSMYTDKLPVGESYSGRVCEMVATATQDSQYLNVYIPSVETFFIEQCQTMVISLDTFYRTVLLHPDAGTEAHAKVMYNARNQQSFIKAEKRFMRVKELVDVFPEITKKTLQEYYTIHDRDIFQPFVECMRRNTFTLKALNKGLLQPYALRKNVDVLNKTMMYGYNAKYKKVKPWERGEISEVAKAVQKPLREIMDIVNIQEANAFSKVLILSKDVTVREMMHLLLYMYERLVDQVKAAAQKGAAYGKIYQKKQAEDRAKKKQLRLKRQRETAARATREVAAGGGEEKRGEARLLAQEIHAFKLMNQLNLRF